MNLSRLLPQRRRTTFFWVINSLAAVIIFAVLWVAIRGIMARNELMGAQPLAHQVEAAVMSGDTSSLAQVTKQLQDRASTAAALTSDPIWRVVEIVPYIGPNLTAFRQAAHMVDHVTSDAVPPLTKLATTFSVTSFAPQGGRFDLAPFQTASPTLTQARVALDGAYSEAKQIDTTSTVSQIGEAVDQLVALVSQTKETVDGLDTAAKLLPSMLGGTAPRSYLLLSLNNAELRASGGIAGALTVVSADNGKLTITGQVQASVLGEFPDPVLPLTPTELTLYQPKLGKFMQDVNLTPDFARAAALAQTMWLKHSGQTVDGVISIDPVALGYILKATGPVDAGGGVSLDSTNAASWLLNGVYKKFPQPADQAKVFAETTKHLFAAMTGGKLSSKELINAFSAASTERRLNIWSSHADEEALLTGSTLAGGLPVSTKSHSAFGVYLNDGTGAKMDYYLTAGTAIGSGLCRVDGRPNFEVRVKLTSSAPADSATSLPWIITGGNVYGITPGNISTGVYIYAPAGSQAYSVKIDGTQTVFSAGDHEGRSVAAVNLQLTPGQTSEVVMEFLGKKGSSTSVSLEHTPMASAMTTSVDDYLDCRGVQPTDHSVSGALGYINSLHL